MNNNQGNHPTDALKTALVLVVAATVAYRITGAAGWFYAALITGIVSFASGRAAALIHRLWSGLSRVLGYVVPNIILFLVYFVILTPIALIYKISGRNQKHIKGSSTYVSLEKTFDKTMLEKMW